MAFNKIRGGYVPPEKQHFQMKWYKYNAYFRCWFNLISFIISIPSYFSIDILIKLGFDIDESEVAPMLTASRITAVLVVAVCVYEIINIYGLLRFKSWAPTVFCLLGFVELIPSGVYEFAVANFTGNATAFYLVFINVLRAVLLYFINDLYFKKRKVLFDN